MLVERVVEVKIARGILRFRGKGLMIP